MSGLEGVVVAATEISRVNGERGELCIRGRWVQQLASLPFDEVRAVVLSRSVTDERQQVLADSRAETAIEQILKTLCQHTDQQPDQLSGFFQAAVISWHQEDSGANPALSEGEDLLRRCGLPFDSLRGEALEAYWATVVDHGMNASTFTSRVIASTGADTVSCVLGGLCALSGPLHGGAPGPVLDLLDSLVGVFDLEEELSRRVQTKQRLMGFGHRVYRARDPRAAVLERWVERLRDAGVGGGRLDHAQRVERAATSVLHRRHPNRKMFANVEFYTALLLDALGFERSAFSGLFACARVVGWIAHIEEQRERGRLIRPSSCYIGASPNQERPVTGR